jgi:hypothetical protein
MLSIIRAFINLVHSHVISNTLWFTVFHNELLIPLEHAGIVLLFKLLELCYLGLKIIFFNLIRHQLILSLCNYIAVVLFDLAFSYLLLRSKIIFIYDGCI